MYTLGPLSRDEVVVLQDIPQSSIGAPCPAVIADEQHLAVVFYLEEHPAAWDGTSVRVVGPDSLAEPVAVVTFARALAYYHGMPNDEAFAGHPLYCRGLEPYGAYEILHSSWRIRLMEMNRTHPCHTDESYARLRHFVLAFHDSTFECVAESYTVATGRGNIREFVSGVLEEMGE